MNAALDLGDAIWVEFFKALFTALLVTGGAWVVTSRFQRKHEEKVADREREHDEQMWKRQVANEQNVRDRERENAMRAARADFVSRAATLAGHFYLQTQDYRRGQRDPEAYGKLESDSLNAAYLKWAADSEVLEHELGFWFGYGSEAHELWHAVRDLLTVRYFWLRGHAKSEPFLNANAMSDDGHHSGLTLAELKAATADDADSTDKSPAAQVILTKYHETLRKLAVELDVTGQKSASARKAKSEQVQAAQPSMPRPDQTRRFSVPSSEGVSRTVEVGEPTGTVDELRLREEEEEL